MWLYFNKINLKSDEGIDFELSYGYWADQYCDVKMNFICENS